MQLSAADKAKGQFQLEQEERKLIFESVCELLLFTIISLTSREVQPRQKRAIINHTHAASGGTLRTRHQQVGENECKLHYKSEDLDSSTRSDSLKLCG